MKRILNLVLSAALSLSLVCPVLAASQTELDAVAAYMQEHDIMTGDQNGSLNLSSGLNRAELAVLLTRLNGGIEEVRVNTAFYERNCKYTDVPAWARLYVGYCAKRNLMVGYGSGIFGSNDLVTPAMACTVVLRACGIMDGDGSVWNYNTACSYAASLGWIDESATRNVAITRGDMAILIYRALNGTGQEPIPITSKNLGDGYLTNGKPITEENVLDLLRQIEQDWPTGTIWETHNTPGTHKNEVPSTASRKIMQSYHVSNVYGCGAYASMVSSLIFGDETNPGRKLEDLSQLRPGDIIFQIRNDTGKIVHVTLALESPSEINAFHITEGNVGGTIQWPDKADPYGRENLDSYRGENTTYRLEVWTRYPESVPYTGNSVMGWPTGT